MISILEIVLVLVNCNSQIFAQPEGKIPCGPINKPAPTTYPGYPDACQYHTPRGTCTGYETKRNSDKTITTTQLPPNCHYVAIGPPNDPQPSFTTASNINNKNNTGHIGPVCSFNPVTGQSTSLTGNDSENCGTP
jgi:hypothetical protein